MVKVEKRAKEQDAIFEKEYKNLNKEQKKAVDAIEGPVMVIAGPGTGKTTILTLRIANILKQTDTPASGVLALTFTESGVKSMKSKLRKVVGDRADEVRIHTFHGFASSVISEFSDHFAHLSRSKQITDIEAVSYIKKIIKDKKFAKLRPLGDPDYYVNKIISAISDAKKEAQSPDDVRKFAKEEIQRVKDDPNSISSRGASKGELKADALKRIDKCEKTILFADVYEEYEKKKKEDFKMDFDDLLYELLLALKNDELLLRLLQEKFLYILVDEHQDTNDSQNLIVSYLANFFENPNLFVVGDEKQAIYRFQGASVENFLKFQNTWKDMQIITLEDNYRSHQRILDAVFSMIEKNYGDGEHEKLRIKLRSGSKIKEQPIDLILPGNVSAGKKYLVEEIKKIQKSDPDSSIAVICRWNREVDSVLDLLTRNNIEVSAERGVDIFSHEVGVMYFKLLEFILSPENTESLAVTVSSGLWGLDLEKAINVLKNIKSGNISEVSKTIPKIDEIRSNLGLLGPIDFLITLGEESGLITKERLLNPQSSEVWRAIIELAKEIAEANNIQDSLTLVSELVSYKKTADNKNIKIGYGNMDSKVQVMTAHSSKGLEYDYVILPMATQDSWSPRNKGTSFVLPKEKDEGDNVKDSRRLFYVSLTRAKKHAIIVAPQEKDSGEMLLPVGFIDELESTSISRIELPKVNSVPETQGKNSLISKNIKDLLDYSTRVILEKGLSVTALNHYLKCPSEFLYKSILKVPEAPSPTSEKGIAMHKAMSEVWRQKLKSSRAIKDLIDKTVKAYFEVSLLDKTEKEIILEELLSQSKDVSTALESHFNSSGDVFTDRWLEKTIPLDGKEVKLHGQIDSIVSSESLVLIFDYKTKEGMSVNDIKGLTKSSDGNYWRQLIFYKILGGNHFDFKNKNIETSLVFIKPDSKGRCPIVTLNSEKQDEERVMSEVSGLVKGVTSGEFIGAKCEDVDCEYCRYKNILLH